MKILLLTGVALLFAAAGALALANLAFDSRSVRTHSIDGPVREIVVRSHGGDVDLVPGGERMVVRETQRYVFERPTLDRSLDAGVLTLDTGCDGGFAFDCSTDLRISVPSDVRVGIDADSGDVEARRIAVAELVVESDSGGVALELAGSPALVRAHTDSGSVDVAVPDATAVDAESDSGDVTVRAGGDPRRVAAHTDSGDVDVEVPPGDYAVRAATDSGDVEVGGGIVRDGRSARTIAAETDSGDVTIRARRAARARAR